MANGHLHSIDLENNTYHHLFNLMFMTKGEILVLQNLLNGELAGKHSGNIKALHSIKQSVEQIINMAIARDTQPEAEPKESIPFPDMEKTSAPKIIDVEVVKDETVEAIKKSKAEIKKSKAKTKEIDKALKEKETKDKEET